MKIKEVMIKPVLISPNATKKQLVAIARKHPHMPIFIVADKKGRFLGDIHENDLFYMLIPNEHYDEIGMEFALDMERKFFANRAKDIMRKNDLSCSPDDDFKDVVLDLAGDEANEMPVIDSKGKVVGVITQGILLRHLTC